MQLFLSSSPADSNGTLNAANGFAAALLAALSGASSGLFITSDPDDVPFTDGFAGSVQTMLNEAGASFREFTALDHRNAASAAALVHNADFIVLAGGHVPTQNRFFREIGLRGLIRDFDGTILGISAGTMNCADIVYAQPELDGEAADPNYRRFLDGLGLTKRMILPHYQATREEMLDGMRLFEDITYPDSIGREFIAIPDGSWLHSDGDAETLHGEAWRISGGELAPLCSANAVLPL